LGESLRGEGGESSLSRWGEATRRRGKSLRRSDELAWRTWLIDIK